MTSPIVVIVLPLIATLIIAGLGDNKRIAHPLPASQVLPLTNPTPYTYRLGERVSLERGGFSEVADWNNRHLPVPLKGHRWVQHGDTYLLLDTTTSTIGSILKATLSEDRG